MNTMRFKVIEADGKRRDVDVRECVAEDGSPAWEASHADERGPHYESGATPRAAAAVLAGRLGWQVREVLDVASPENDWRGLPSHGAAIAHALRSGGDCSAPWLWLREGEDYAHGARLEVVHIAPWGDHEAQGVEVRHGSDLARARDAEAGAGLFRPIGRRGEAMPHPTAAEEGEAT